MKEQKAALRASAREARQAAHERHGRAAGEALARHGIGFAGPKPGAAISGFSAIRDEINPGLLLANLHAAGHMIGLPVMQGKGLPLLFRAWLPGAVTQEAVWGIQEPGPDAPLVEPDILLVPLLAFDMAGYRVGYGGGFYDRTLAELRAKKTVTAIGVAYDEQRVDAVPHLDYDEPLDWVLTPSGPIRCSGK